MFDTLVRLWTSGMNRQWQFFAPSHGLAPCFYFLSIRLWRLSISPRCHVHISMLFCHISLLENKSKLYSWTSQVFLWLVPSWSPIAWIGDRSRPPSAPCKIRRESVKHAIGPFAFWNLSDAAFRYFTHLSLLEFKHRSFGDERNVPQVVAFQHSYVDITDQSCISL